MLILCTGLGSPPFPWTGRFGVDKHVSGTDVALEAYATVQPYVQTRSDFASISPSRGVLDLPWEGQGVSLVSSGHSLPLPTGSFLSRLINSPLLQLEPLTFQWPPWVKVGQIVSFLLAVALKMFKGPPLLPQLSLHTDAFVRRYHKIPWAPFPQSLDSTKFSFWLKRSYLPSRALLQNPKRCGTC